MSDPALHDDLVRRLVELRAVSSDGGSLRTTRRFQAAMARAAAEAVRRREQRFDLRIPVAAALLELVEAGANGNGEHLSDELLASLVELVVPLEAGGVARPVPPSP